MPAYWLKNTTPFIATPIAPSPVSVGVAAYPEHGDTAQIVTENADAALLQAKERGRNRVVEAPLLGV